MSKEQTPKPSDTFTETYQRVTEAARKVEAPQHLQAAWEQGEFHTHNTLTTTTPPFWAGWGQGFAAAAMLCTTAVALWWVVTPTTPTSHPRVHGRTLAIGSKTAPTRKHRQVETRVAPKPHVRKAAALPRHPNASSHLRLVQRLRRAIVTCLASARRDVFRVPQYTKSRVLRVFVFQRRAVHVRLPAQLDQPQVQACLGASTRRVFTLHKHRIRRSAYQFVVGDEHKRKVYFIDTEVALPRRIRRWLRGCLQPSSGAKTPKWSVIIRLLLHKEGGFAFSIQPIHSNIPENVRQSTCLQMGVLQLKYKGTPFTFKNTGALMQSYLLLRWRVVWDPHLLPTFSIALEQRLTSKRPPGPK